MSEDLGVVFPAGRSDGRRSTAALGRAVVADALRAGRPGRRAGRRAGDELAGRATWRTSAGSVEAGSRPPRDAARRSPAAGLDSLHARMRVAGAGGEHAARRLRDGARPAAARAPSRSAGRPSPSASCRCPTAASGCAGTTCAAGWTRWVDAGVVEPGCADAVAHGRRPPRVAAPCPTAPSRCSAPAPRWGRCRAAALGRPGGRGRPAPPGAVAAGAGHAPGAARARCCCRCRRAPATGRRRPAPTCSPRCRRSADWLGGLGGPLVLGNYVYADGATNVRVSVAVDALSRAAADARARPGARLPGHPHRRVRRPGATRWTQSVAAYDAPVGRRRRLLGRPLRTLSAGRLLRRAYVAGRRPRASTTAWCRSRARTTRWPSGCSAGGPPSPGTAGRTVSMNVAPPTRTRSVVKNRALAAAYAGAHRFGVEVFEPATSNVLMAALLVHDLHTGGGPRARAPVAGRGVRRGARRAVAHAVRPAQRARARRRARVRRRPHLSPPGGSGRRPAGGWSVPSRPWGAGHGGVRRTDQADETHPLAPAGVDPAGMRARRCRVRFTGVTPVAGSRLLHVPGARMSVAAETAATAPLRSHGDGTEPHSRGVPRCPAHPVGPR